MNLGNKARGPDQVTGVSSTDLAHAGKWTNVAPLVIDLVGHAVRVRKCTRCFAIGGSVELISTARLPRLRLLLVALKVGDASEAPERPSGCIPISTEMSCSRKAHSYHLTFGQPRPELLLVSTKLPSSPRDRLACDVRFVTFSQRNPSSQWLTHLLETKLTRKQPHRYHSRHFHRVSKLA